VARAAGDRRAPLTYWNSKRLAPEFTRPEIYPLGHHAVDALLAGRLAGEGVSKHRVAVLKTVAGEEGSEPSIS
jgi:hypothetical protein